MSGVNAINTSNIAFSGKKPISKAAIKSAHERTKAKSIQERRESTPHVKKVTIKDKIAANIIKQYGLQSKDDIKPYVIANYMTDKALKLGAGVTVGVATFAIGRKATAGMTQSFIDTIQKKGAGAAQQAHSFVGRLLGNYSDLNGKAREAFQAGAGKQDGLIRTFKKAIFNPVKDIDPNSALAGCSKGFQNFCKKIGIRKGADIGDLALAGLGTTVAVCKTHQGVGAVTEQDNKEIGKMARIEGKIANAANRAEDGLKKVQKTLDGFAKVSEMLNGTRVA